MLKKGGLLILDIYNLKSLGKDFENVKLAN